MCRYDLNGFVEELPRLPGGRSGHACASIPISVLNIGQVVIVTPKYGFPRKSVNFQ